MIDVALWWNEHSCFDLVVWQYMKFWCASREYDYKPWVYIVNWILEGFQILEVLWKMITYMYRFIYKHMKIPEGLQLSEACTLNSRKQYSIRLKSLYRLKQSGRVWYNYLNEYLLKEWYKNDPICPCIFMKRCGNEFAIIFVCVDDINIIGTLEELDI